MGKLTFDLNKGLDKTGLVQVQRTVSGKHGTYQRMQWVRSSDVKPDDKVVGGQKPVSGDKVSKNDKITPKVLQDLPIGAKISIKNGYYGIGGDSIEYEKQNKYYSGLNAKVDAFVPTGKYGAPFGLGNTILEQILKESEVTIADDYNTSDNLGEKLENLTGLDMFGQKDAVEDRLNSKEGHREYSIEQMSIKSVKELDNGKVEVIANASGTYEDRGQTDNFDEEVRVVVKKKTQESQKPESKTAGMHKFSVGDSVGLRTQGGVYPVKIKEAKTGTDGSIEYIVVNDDLSHRYKEQTVKESQLMKMGGTNTPTKNNNKVSTTATAFSSEEFSKLKSDRPKAIQYLKDNGITWKETDNVSINWMRACMAASKGTQKATSVPTTPKPTATSTSVDKKAINDFLTQHGGDRAKAMEAAKAAGVTWKESDNAGINWMRAALAIQKYGTISSTSEAPKSNESKKNESIETKVPSEEEMLEKVKDITKTLKPYKLKEIVQIAHKVLSGESDSLSIYISGGYSGGNHGGTKDPDYTSNIRETEKVFKKLGLQVYTDRRVRKNHGYATARGGRVYASQEYDTHITAFTLKPNIQSYSESALGEDTNVVYVRDNKVLKGKIIKTPNDYGKTGKFLIENTDDAIYLSDSKIIEVDLREVKATYTDKNRAYFRQLGKEQQDKLIGAMTKSPDYNSSTEAPTKEKPFVTNETKSGRPYSIWQSGSTIYGSVPGKEDSHDSKDIHNFTQSGFNTLDEVKDYIKKYF